MARNKYPEETVQKILEVSYRLFREKGYDHTTIQDIVDALGMSKGAIYHHFKSKEEILDRINDRYYDEVNWFRDIRLDPELTGLEKLREVLRNLFTDSRKQELDNIQLSIPKNPRVVAMVLQSSVHDAAPFFQRLVEEGIRDGSVSATRPKELSEALMILMNLWMGMCASGREDFARKLDFFQEFTEKMGLPLLDDSLRRIILGYFDGVMPESGWI